MGLDKAIPKTEKEVKLIKTSLDDLPNGKPGQEFEKDRRGRAKMPEGLTSKTIYKDITRIAWPSFLELVLTQLTSMADQIMVGQLPGQLGVMALSAVGLSAQPKFLLMTMIQALNVGATAMVARFRGQNNREKANTVFRQAILLNLALSAIFAVFGAFFDEELIRFIAGTGISEETMAYAAEYFRIQMYGFVPLAVTFTCTAVLRGIGDTKTPMVYNIISNVVNLIFNYFLIYGKFGFPEMDVAGASIATVIGQMVAFFIALYIVLSKKRYVYLEFKKNMFKFDSTIMNNVVAIGFPSMVEQLFMRAGMIIFTRAVTDLGDTQYATHQVCMNIQSMTFMIGQAFGNAATTLVGQSLGKSRHDMAEIFIRHTQHIGMACSAVVGVLMFFFGGDIVWLYNQTPEIVQWGGNILMLVAFLQPVQATQFIVAGGLRGAGDTRYTAIVMLVTVLFVRASLAMLMIRVFHWGLWGAWIALACDQCLRSLLIVLRYRSGKWKNIRLKGQP